MFVHVCHQGLRGGGGGGGGRGVGGGGGATISDWCWSLGKRPREVHSCIRTYNMLHNVIDTINAQINAAEYTTTV